MDKKVLVLCDEEVGSRSRNIKIRDLGYLESNKEEKEDIIYVNWETIIPKDNSFIMYCRELMKNGEIAPLDFTLMQKGALLEGKNIRKSLLEQSHAEEYYEIAKFIRELSQKENMERSAVMERLLDRSVNYPFTARHRFFVNFSKLMKENNISKVMQFYYKFLEKDVVLEREEIMSSWKNANIGFRDNKADAELINMMPYFNFGEANLLAINEFGRSKMEKNDFDIE